MVPCYQVTYLISWTHVLHGGGDLPADLGGAGEGDELHPGVLAHALAHLGAGLAQGHDGAGKTVLLQDGGHDAGGGHGHLGGRGFQGPLETGVKIRIGSTKRVKSFVFGQAFKRLELLQRLCYMGLETAYKRDSAIVSTG